MEYIEELQNVFAPTPKTLQSNVNTYNMLVFHRRQTTSHLVCFKTHRDI